MTNISTMLESLTESVDLESIEAIALENYGISIFGVYCQHTGRRVGTFDQFVIDFALAEEESSDEEALADALVARVVASMRPTPMLNRPDRITLLNLAAKHPVDVCTYLINRLHSNRYLATHRNFDVLEPHLAKIHAHARWTAIAESGVDLSPWIHWLLELDAKRNLHDLTPPYITVNKKNELVLSTHGDSLFSLVGIDNAAEMLAAFESWTFAQIEEYDHRDSVATAQANWMRGNPMTQPAYVRSWLENPEIAGRKKPTALRRGTGLEPVKQKRVSKVDGQLSKFMHLLEGILDDEIKPVTPKKAGPVLRTGGMLFKKKESN